MVALGGKSSRCSNRAQAELLMTANTSTIALDVPCGSCNLSGSWIRNASESPAPPVRCLVTDISTCPSSIYSALALHPVMDIVHARSHGLLVNHHGALELGIVGYQRTVPLDSCPVQTQRPDHSKTGDPRSEDVGLATLRHAYATRRSKTRRRRCLRPYAPFHAPLSAMCDPVLQTIRQADHERRFPIR